jgi:phospholipid transport system substrate-binding protein
MKKIAIVVCLIWGFMLGGVAIAANSSDPVALVKSLADEMIANLKANKTNLKKNPSLVYSLAYKIVVPYADLDEMSQRVLPPRTWNSASPSQRAEFKKQFTALLVRTYASALADYTDQTVRFFPLRAGGGRSVTVNSQIVRSDGPAVSVSYRLHATSSGWRLYDMTVEGVSLLQSFQEQFRQKVSQGATIDQLISDLNQRSARRARQ